MNNAREKLERIYDWLLLRDPERNSLENWQARETVCKLLKMLEGN
jgi:hypothetical protein